MAIKFSAALHGLVPNKSAIVDVQTMNLGGDDPAGILTPSDVVLELVASRYSSLLLGWFVDQAAHKVVVDGYEPNVQGLEKNFLRITLTQARISSYRMSAVVRGKLTDTLHLTFATLDYDYVQDNADFVWTPA